MNPANENIIEREQFAEEVLEAHNAYRMRHGVPPLLLDEHLSEQSRESARYFLNEENEDAVLHPDLGENILFLGAADLDQDLTGDVPVNKWYGERYNLIGGELADRRRRLSFTQIVWKSTRFLGVGKARNGDRIVIVCNYLPAGNISGEYIHNVMPALQECNGYH